MRADLPEPIEVQGDGSLLEFLDRTRSDLRSRRLKEFWQEGLEVLTDSIREEAPQWKGTLQSDIREEIQVFNEEEIVGASFTDVTYGPLQERGTDPFWPGIDTIRPWAEDHNIEAYLVARAISERGLRPLKFFELGLLNVKEVLARQIGDFVAEILEGSSGVLDA